MPWLIELAGPEPGKVFEIPEAATTLGRDTHNHLAILDEYLSRKHAMIRLVNQEYELTDLSSANGVFVNGAKITRWPLREGDEIKLGSTRLTFTFFRPGTAGPRRG